MKKEKTADQPPRFEEVLSELETIVNRLEGGELGLEAALKEYESGVKHLRNCYTLLEKIERRVELLSGVDDQGRPVTEPFDDEATGDEAVGKRRVKKKKAPRKKPEPEEDDPEQRLF